MEQLVKNNLEKLNEEIKDLKANKDNTFDVIATTDDVDRDWEIIKTDGWDTANWFKNPVVLWNHSYKIESIAWKGTDFYKDENGKMRLKGVFSNNEMWKMARELYNWGFLKAVSVWFIVKQRNESDRLIIEKAELLEISFVAVPANPEAISMDWKSYEKAVKSGLVIKEEDKKWDEEEKDNDSNIVDYSSLWNLTEKELELVSWMHDMFSKILKDSMEEMKLAFDEKIDNIKKSIKDLKQEDKPDDNGNNTPDDSKEKELFKKFLQTLSKWASETLCQLKK